MSDHTGRLGISPLTPLEVATGLLIGREPGHPPLEPVDVVLSPRAALEAEVLKALRRAPCFVSFSGGRDSSAVLAVATYVARRSRLPDPIPVSLRFPRVESTDESLWQQRVVEHLGLNEWVRLFYTDEMDVIGPFAARVLATHGVRWPLNTHFHVPMMELASGGSLLTGVGGDEIFTPTVWQRLAAVEAGQLPAGPLDRLRGAVAYGPAPLRKRWMRQHFTDIDLPWLTPAAARSLRSQLVDAAAAEPVSHAQWVREVWWPSRYRLMGQESLQALARDSDVQLLQPLQSEAFLSAVAATYGAPGFRSRTGAMRDLFADVLPKPVLSRSTKSWFDEAFVTNRSLQFARAWDGYGLDPTVVRPEALRQAWLDNELDARSLLALQASALEAGGTARDEPLHPPLFVGRGCRPAGPIPSCYIAGGFRSGISLLVALLRRHPDVWFGQNPQPHYIAYAAAPTYVDDLTEAQRTLESEYRAVYEGVPAGGAVIDASSSSLTVPGTAERILALSPNARIVVVLREPVARAVSHYAYAWATGRELLANADEALLRPTPADVRLVNDYLGASSFAAGLARYMTVFGRDRVHVEVFEDLRHDPQAAYFRVLAFLGLAPEQLPPPPPPPPPVLLPRAVPVHDLVYGRSHRGGQLDRLVLARALKAARAALEPWLKVQPHVTDRVRAVLSEQLMSERQELEELLDRPLSRWWGT